MFEKNFEWTRFALHVWGLHGRKKCERDRTKVAMFSSGEDVPVANHCRTTYFFAVRFWKSRMIPCSHEARCFLRVVPRCAAHSPTQSAGCDAPAKHKIEYVWTYHPC